MPHGNIFIGHLFWLSKPQRRVSFHAVFSLSASFDLPMPEDCNHPKVRDLLASSFGLWLLKI